MGLLKDAQRLQENMIYSFLQQQQKNKTATLNTHHVVQCASPPSTPHCRRLHMRCCCRRRRLASRPTVPWLQRRPDVKPFCPSAPLRRSCVNLLGNTLSHRLAPARVLSASPGLLGCFAHSLASLGAKPREWVENTHLIWIKIR